MNKTNADKISDAPQAAMGQVKFLFICFILLIVWGSAFTMTDVAVRSLSPIWVVATRLVLATIFILVFLFIRALRLPPLSDKRWLWYAFLGCVGMTLPFFLISKGLETIESGLSAILVGAMPLMTVILAHFFTDERMTWLKFIGFLIGFFGLIILFFPEDFSLELIADWKAQALVLGAAFCYAVSTVAAKLAPNTHAFVGAAMMLICASIIAIVAALIEGIPQTQPDPIVYSLIIGLAIGSTGIGTILYLYVIDVMGPSIMAAINYFIPVISVILGIMILDEKLTLQIIIAFLAIIAGVAISRIKKRP